MWSPSLAWGPSVLDSRLRDSIRWAREASLPSTASSAVTELRLVERVPALDEAAGWQTLISGTGWCLIRVPSGTGTDGGARSTRCESLRLAAALRAGMPFSTETPARVNGHAAGCSMGWSHKLEV